MPSASVVPIEILAQSLDPAILGFLERVSPWVAVVFVLAGAWVLVRWLEIRDKRKPELTPADTQPIRLPVTLDTVTAAVDEARRDRALTQTKLDELRKRIEDMGAQLEDLWRLRDRDDVPASFARRSIDETMQHIRASLSAMLSIHEQQRERDHSLGAKLDALRDSLRQILPRGGGSDLA